MFQSLKLICRQTIYQNQNMSFRFLSSESGKRLKFALSTYYFALEFEREYTGREWSEIIKKEYKDKATAEYVLFYITKVRRRTTGGIYSEV